MGIINDILDFSKIEAGKMSLEEKPFRLSDMLHSIYDHFFMSKSTFFNQVYAIVATIPKGKVMTYGQISSLLENRYSGMFVGFAMSAAPEERCLPCHRVVNRKGEMAPGLIFGGQDAQRDRLRREGVRFLPDGRIDMKKSLWHEAELPDNYVSESEGGGYEEDEDEDEDS